MTARPKLGTTMIKLLQDGLSSRNGLIRKGAAAALRVPRWWQCVRARPEQYGEAPPVFVNSFPKSGTHLLFQIVEGLPNTVVYGGFLPSMTSSFGFSERSAENAAQVIRGFVPGEIVRGHLFFDSQSAAELVKNNSVNYFIYRDPRAVVVSEAHYLRAMNRWHRLAPYFRKLPSIENAITLSITGFNPPIPGLIYPNIAERFARYEGWLTCNNCLGIRFEDLVSENQVGVIRQMIDFYAQHCTKDFDREGCLEQMRALIAPHKSHTFRSGKMSGWRTEFTKEHRRLFGELAGDLLIRLGYEKDLNWVVSGAPALPTLTPDEPTTLKVE
jgi:hypothetical protein